MKKLLVILITLICFNRNAAAEENIYPALRPYHHNELIFQTPNYLGRIDNMDELEGELEPDFQYRLALWKNGKNMSDKPDILAKTAKLDDYEMYENKEDNLYFYKSVYDGKHYILSEDDKEENYTFSVYEPLIYDEVKILKSTKNKKVYSKLAPYKSNISVFKYKDWLMRVDNMTDSSNNHGVYRFAAWHNKTMDKKPDIVIENGKPERNWVAELAPYNYVFENSKYKAIFTINLYGVLDTKPYFITLYKIISSEKANILED